MFFEKYSEKEHLEYLPGNLGQVWKAQKIDIYWHNYAW